MPEVPPQPTRINVLRTAHLLQAVADADLERLAENTNMVFAPRGEVIWQTGGGLDYFCIVGSGFVKMSRSAPGATNIATEIMGPGQAFGLLGLLDGAGCPQTARAVTPLWYLKVYREVFMPLYHENPVLKERLVRRTSSRLRRSFEMLGHLSTGRVPQRVAAILLELADSFGHETAEGIKIDVPLTRQDIADLAGTTVESTIRTMSKWQKAGWITTEAHMIWIHDVQSIIALLRG